MKDNATFEQLEPVMREAVAYGHRSIMSDKVRKQVKLGHHLVEHRVNTPKDYGHNRVLYIYAFALKRACFRTFLLLEGKEGDSYAGAVFNAENKVDFYIVHGHAIRRYMERRKFTGTLQEAELKVLNGLMVSDVQKDSTDNTMYLYFDGGVFLCTNDDRVLHLRTFIMNRQCSTMQRMKSLKSENETKTFKRELGIYEP